jgi:hypothetical protein
LNLLPLGWYCGLFLSDPGSWERSNLLLLRRIRGAVNPVSHVEYLYFRGVENVIFWQAQFNGRSE